MLLPGSNPVNLYSLVTDGDLAENNEIFSLWHWHTKWTNAFGFWLIFLSLYKKKLIILGFGFELLLNCSLLLSFVFKGKHELVPSYCLYFHNRYVSKLHYLSIWDVGHHIKVQQIETHCQSVLLNFLRTVRKKHRIVTPNPNRTKLSLYNAFNREVEK